MMAKRNHRATGATEGGNAIVEFIGVIVVLIIPAITLLAGLATVTAAQFAANAAARESARAFVRAASSAAATGVGIGAANDVVADRGISATHTTGFTCSASPCLTPGATVESHVSISVRLPIVGTTVTVTDASSMRVDEFRRSR